MVENMPVYLSNGRVFSLLSKLAAFKSPALTRIANGRNMDNQEITHGITYFKFQSATVTAQGEAMSARNAQLEIENESLKNELQNSRADYTALQVDMNDVRDYYHQIDIAASKMGHRCEVRRRIPDSLYCESWWGLIVMIRLAPGTLMYFW